MQLNDLKKRLGYKNVNDMIDIVGMKYKNMMRIKEDNPDRYRMILNDIIMQHFGLDAGGLLDLCSNGESCGEK